MDNLQLIAMQTQRVMQRRLETAANNLANVSTHGFKADALLTEMDSRRPARSTALPTDVRFVRDVGLTRNMLQGPITTTGEPLDVAIEGAGFFAVQGPGGETLYTRDGAFRMDDAGQLVTGDGAPVLNAGGAPLVFDPQGERPQIGADGAITIAGAEVGRLGVTAFADEGGLEKVGDNLWAPKATATAPFEGKVVQGALEGSNVNPVLELTRIIEISRAYESAARIVRNGDDLRQRAIERLGRAA
jgi:flagellar basal-body rod protein FlgF